MSEVLYYPPGAPMRLETYAYPTSQVGTIGVHAVTLTDRSVVIPRTTAGIAFDPTAGAHWINTILAPLVRGDYDVLWDAGEAEPWPSQRIIVTSDAPVFSDTPGLISDSDIAGIRSTVNALLPDTALIRRSTSQAPDGQGGVVGTPTVIATSPVMVSDRREMAAELIGTERVESVVGWILTFPAGTNVTAKDDVQVGTRTFQVLGILSGSYETDRRAVCAEATP